MELEFYSLFQFLPVLYSPRLGGHLRCAMHGNLNAVHHEAGLLAWDAVDAAEIDLADDGKLFGVKLVL